MAETLGKIVASLEAYAPLAGAESWDNVGLLAGDRSMGIERIMTCLTVDDRTVEEAIGSRVHLVVSHHPIPFRPITRVVGDDGTGKHLWEMMRHGVAIYSPHTAWDNAANGINQMLAEKLGLQEIEPLVEEVGKAGLGSGRMGRWETGMGVEAIRDCLSGTLIGTRWRCNEYATRHEVQRLGIVCGSGGSFVGQAARVGCDGLLTGEVTYHQALEAQFHGLALIWFGHYPSERFAMEWMAERLRVDFPTVEVWASRNERDPIVAM